MTGNIRRMRHQTFVALQDNFTFDYYIKAALFQFCTLLFLNDKINLAKAKLQ